MNERRYERLRKALEKGTISIGFYDRALLRPDSPAFSWPDILIPGVLMLIALILDFAFAPLSVALLSLGAAIAIVMLGYVRWIKRRVRKRAWKLALSGVDNWNALWESGGVSIWLARRIGIGCDSPDGDWSEFVRHQVDRARPSTGAAPTPSDFRQALSVNRSINDEENKFQDTKRDTKKKSKEADDRDRRRL
tara:strand:- start:867 stop:1445 length:579 start_codon:yes stop_codon:yes gene_type:complete